MNKAIRKALRAEGYTGSFADAEAIKAFLAENPIDFRTPDGKTLTPDQVAAEAKTVTITVAADAGEDVVVVDNSPEAAAGDEDEADGKMDDEDETEPKHARNQRVKRAAAMSPNTAMTPAARVRRAKARTYNRRAGEGKTVFGDAEAAEAFGSWARMTIYGHRDYAEKQTDLDLLSKTMMTVSPAAGGSLVPAEFRPELIDLRLSYGVAEAEFTTIPMKGDTLDVPRVTAEPTVYSPGEGGAGTDSDVATDLVTLTARKRLTITKVTNELLHDSPIDVGDMVARKVAYAFAKDLDRRAFNGDGTSTYAGDVGLTGGLKALSGTIANISGLKVGAGDTYAELVLTDFQGVVTLLPDFEGIGDDAKWYVNKAFYFGTMVPLVQTASIASAAAELLATLPKMYLGYNVRFVNAMPKVEAVSQVCALLGHAEYAGMIGVVNDSMEIASSEHFDFDNDLVTIRGRFRSAVNCHDLGNATATAADKQPGAVVGLITAAS
jgi:HK97 family phage major capsid protein